MTGSTEEQSGEILSSANKSSHTCLTVTYSTALLVFSVQECLKDLIYFFFVPNMQSDSLKDCTHANTVLLVMVVGQTLCWLALTPS